LREAFAQNVSVSDDALVVDLADGRTIAAPLAWFPRLAHGTAAERANWRLIAGGEESTGRSLTKISAWRVSWRDEDQGKKRRFLA
jgi:hypothetical protein